MAVVVGTISNYNGVDSKTTYIRMSLVLIIFFILGLYIRSTIYKIEKEVRKKKQTEELKKIEELRKAHVEREAAKKASGGERKKGKEEQKHSVDYTVDDNSYEADINPAEEKLYDEEFTPLKVDSITVDRDIKDNGQ